MTDSNQNKAEQVRTEVLKNGADVRETLNDLIKAGEYDVVLELALGHDDHRNLAYDAQTEYAECFHATAAGLKKVYEAVKRFENEHAIYPLYKNKNIPADTKRSIAYYFHEEIAAYED